MRVSVCVFSFSYELSACVGYGKLVGGKTQRILTTDARQRQTHESMFACIGVRVCVRVLAKVLVLTYWQEHDSR